MLLTLAVLGCVSKPPSPLRPTAPEGSEPFRPSALGRWEGVLRSDPPIPVRCTVTEQDATLAVGDQVLPAKAARIGSSFMLEVPAIGVKLIGTLFGDRFEGRWRQGNQERPLTMERRSPEGTTDAR